MLTTHVCASTLSVALSQCVLSEASQCVRACSSFNCSSKRCVNQQQVFILSLFFYSVYERLYLKQMKDEFSCHIKGRFLVPEQQQTGEAQTQTGQLLPVCSLVDQTRPDLTRRDSYRKAASRRLRLSPRRRSCDWSLPEKQVFLLLFFTCEYVAVNELMFVFLRKSDALRRTEGTNSYQCNRRDDGSRTWEVLLYLTFDAWGTSLNAATSSSPASARTGKYLLVFPSSSSWISDPSVLDGLVLFKSVTSGRGYCLCFFVSHVNHEIKTKAF